MPLKKTARSKSQARSPRASRRAARLTPGLNALDEERKSSMANEGGASATSMENQDAGARLGGPVLVAVDLEPGSHEAVRQAHELADALESPLFVCHVLPKLAVRMLFPQLKGYGKSRRGMESDVARAAAARVRALTGRRPEGLRVLVETGSAHAGILRQAEALGAGLVVMGAGGVAERVARRASCPVLIARPSPAGTVLAATDFSDPSLPAIAAGAAEAARRGRPLALLHSLDLQPFVGGVGAGMTAYVLDLSPQEFQRICEDTEERLRRCLARVGASGRALAVGGPPAQAIVEAAARLPAELVVVGTTGRSGLARLALGSTAEAVMRSCPCSTLVVRLHPSAWDGSRRAS
jgi:nucleotide-binding universal stress UspA family protein